MNLSLREQKRLLDGHMQELSLEQKRHWVDYQRCPNAQTNYAQLCYELSGDLELTKFKKAVSTVLNSYNLFKTQFIRSNNFIYKKNILNVTPKLEFESLSHLKLVEAQDKAKNCVEEILNNPIDFFTYPNFRIKLIEITKNTYYFVVSVPHILIDGFSADYLLHDISEYYNNDMELYNAKQEDEIKTDDLYEKQSLYWNEKIENSSSELIFSQRNIRPSKFNHRSNRCYLILKKNTLKNIKVLAKKFQSTPFLVLFSFLSTALYKYSHEKHFSILYSVNTRTLQQNKCIGSFVNLIPMILDLIPKCTLSELIKQITNQRKLDKEYQNFNYSHILSILREDSSNLSSYNVLFSKTRFFPVNFQLNNIQVEFSPFELEKESLFDLTFLYDNDDKEMVLSLDYNESKFDRWFIQQFLLYLENLFEKIHTITEQRLCDIPYFFESKNHFPSINIEKISKDSLQSIFENSVHQFPQRNALSDGNQFWTYEEIDLVSNRWAHYLQSQGIKVQTRVAILLERKPYAIILILALLKLRCAYIPIEKRSPDVMIQDILLDSATEFIISDDLPRITSLNNLNIHCISYDDIERQSETTSQWEAGNPEDLVYILYSSGTTGKAKGIPIHQKNLARLFSVENMSLFDFTSADVWSIAHSLAFDFSVWEIWGAFSQGALALLIPTDVLLTPEKLYAFIDSHQVSILNQTPSYFKKLMWVDHKNTKSLKSLRTIIFGAEKLIPLDLKMWIDKYGIQNPTLINMYGLTEAAVHATFYKIRTEDLEDSKSPIGKPLPDMQGYLLNEYHQEVPPGVKGEICLSGPGITNGYLNRDDLNKKKFILYTHGNHRQRTYCTGDIAQSTPEGEWEYIGRLDDQIKLQGYRIELHIIEEALCHIDGIRQAVVMVSNREFGSKLIAFYCLDISSFLDSSQILNELKQTLPRYMVPTDAISIAEIPITSQGKIDYKALEQHFANYQKQTKKSIKRSHNDVTQSIQILWQKILSRSSSIPLDVSFFEAGGDSIDLLDLHAGLENIAKKSIPFEMLFECTTIQEQSHYLSSYIFGKNIFTSASIDSVKPQKLSTSSDNQSIAIIGMAGRFPGAKDINIFWENLCEGKESITFFTEKDLRDAGISEEILQSSNYVKAKGVLEGAEEFDPDFFNISPTEALLLDPQHRCFLEICWAALEHAGYVEEKKAGKIGVFSGGSSIHNYYQTYLLNNSSLKEQYGEYTLHLGNAPDFLSTRVSFKLNLTGPSITLQTGCSTSLVAVCYALQSLLNHECDVAIAGGVSLTMPIHSGYEYQEGMILSPDGHCRTFDVAAKGTVPGNGVGAIVLKRLSDAIADGDTIDAVIRGHAINNDGGHKLGMTTPRESSQISLLQSALRVAKCDPDEIDYIETHGTGTVQGDRMELAAINSVFWKQPSQRKQSCYLGSVKTNIGHLDSAAGIAGMIKAILCLKYKKWVPSLHFTQSNPTINFSHVPLEVVTKTNSWETENKAKKVGVTALAVGGTNAHVILEEYLEKDEPPVSEKQPLSKIILLLSAKSSDALKIQCNQLALFLSETKEKLDDIAYTLQVGRKHFPYRVAVVGNNKSLLEKKLRELSKKNFDISTPDISILSPIDAETDLARSWEKGMDIDWNAYQQNQRRKRVHLPTYPFERKRFWPESSSTGISANKNLRNPKEQWCYRRTWQYKLTEQKNIPNHILIVFCNDVDILHQLDSAFSGYSKYIYVVRHSVEYSNLDNLFNINPKNKNDYISLFKNISEKNIKNINFLYVFQLTRHEQIKSETSYENFTDFISLIQNISIYFKDDYNIDVTAITNHVWPIIQNDIVNIHKHLLLGPSLTIHQEYSHIYSRVIDVGDHFSQNEIEFLKSDIFQKTNPLISYRHGQRLIEHFESISLPIENTMIIRSSGAYLITGGLGEIGLTFAEYLSSQANVSLILIQRSYFLDHSFWHDEQYLSELTKEELSILERLKKIEETGSKIHIFQCDIVNQIDFNQLLSRIENEMGKIYGVIHAAGNPAGRLIRQIDVNELNFCLDPKVKGTQILHQAFTERPLDFMVFCSALSTVLGYPGQTIYNSVNAFLDAFAHWRTMNSGRTVSINWDSWKNGGMAVKGLQYLSTDLSNKILNSAISHEEGQWIIEKILNLSDPQVIVSTYHPDQNTFNQFIKSFMKSPPSKSLTYEEITAAVEKAWSSYFELKLIDKNSDFFDLGGDSLSAIQMISVLEKSLQIKLSPKDILEHSKFDDFVHFILSNLKINISDEEKKENFSLVSMKNGQEPINLFLIHPIGGTTYIYRDLSSSIKSDINIYSIQSLLLFDEKSSRTDVIQMAKEYIEIIQKKQATGPYYLGGLSFGGLLAYEMAQQIAEAGKDVALVIMFDTPGFNKMPKNLVEDTEILSYMLQVGEKIDFDESKFNLLSLEEQINFFIKNSKNLLQSNSKFTTEDILRYLSIYKSNMKALFSYEIKSCHKNVKKIYYFSAKERDAINPTFPEEGWEKILKNKCTVFKAPGNHITMLFQPNIQAIANILDPIFQNIINIMKNDVPH